MSRCAPATLDYMVICPAMSDVLRMIRPDDWHLHLRDGGALRRTVPDTARCFSRALVMPNLEPPVTTMALASAYRTRILEAANGLDFEPLMTLYLDAQISVAEIAAARESGWIQAIKWYPASVTTGADAGVRRAEDIYPVLEAMQGAGLTLSVHAESPDPALDAFDREQHFIERSLVPAMRRFPALRVVVEHISTAFAVDFVSAGPPNLAATITAHHLLHNRNALLGDGLRAHYFCRPLLKRESDRQALVTAATSGDRRFFLGTDSAPHRRGDKEAACGCAGCYTAPAALEFYATVFEQAGALAQLEDFASRRGADFYGLPLNAKHIELRHRRWQLPKSLDMAGDELVPLAAGEELAWRAEMV